MTATATDTITGEQVTGDVKFGLAQIKNPTPEMANWIFRGYFIISKAVIGWLGGLSAANAINVSVTTMLLITLTVSLLGDPIMLGFSKLFGIENTDGKTSNS